MVFFLLASSLATVFLIRVMPLVLWGRPDLSTGDVINHLNLVDGFRANRHRLPDFQDKFLLAETESYSVMYHWMLSFLPQRVVDHMEPVFGALVETIHGLFLFAAAYLFARHFPFGPNPESVAFIATLLFGATPLLLGIENYGRVFRLSARPFGVLLTTLTFTSIVLFLHTENYAWLGVGGVAFGLVALSSHFGVQAVVLITGFMSIVIADWRPLLIMPIGLVAGTLLSRGHLLRILSGCLYHSYLYCTYFSPITHFTTSYTLTNFISWPVTLFTRPRKAIDLLLTHYLFIPVTLFPWSILLLATYVTRPAWIQPDGSLEKQLLGWYVAGNMAMLLTILPWFRFLGEASRYVIHSVTPVCIIASYRLLWIDDSRLWALTGFLSVVAVAGLMCNYWISFAVRRSDPDRKLLYEWIKNQPASTLLTIDLRLSFLLCFRTPHRAVHFHINAPGGKKLEALKRLLSEAYPFPSNNLDNIIREHDVDLLVVDNNAAAQFSERTGGKQYDFSGYELLYELGRFRVYKTHSTAITGTAEPHLMAVA